MAPTATEAIVNVPRCTSGGTCNSVRVITDIYMYIPTTWALIVINFDCIQLTGIRNYIWTSYTGEVHRYRTTRDGVAGYRQWNYWQQPMINYRYYVPVQMGFPVGGTKSRSATCATTIRRRPASLARMSLQHHGKPPERERDLWSYERIKRWTVSNGST